MNTLWFLIIVFLTPGGNAYLHGDMLPRIAPSEVSCLAKRDGVAKMYAEVKASDPSMHNAEIFCWEAKSHQEITTRLKLTYNFTGGQPA